MHETSQLIHVVAGVIFLLLMAAAVMASSKRLHLPFTVLLVVVGAIINYVASQTTGLEALKDLTLSPDVILYVFLPTLIFESAFNLDVRQLWKNIIPVMTLAVPGLLLSTSIIAGILVWATPIDWLPALLLGAILSATDPVAVIALFKQLGAPKRLTVLVEGESLFNDATAIVLAGILIGGLGVESGSAEIGLWAAAGDFLLVFFGGLAIGFVLSVLTSFLLGAVQADVYIETTLTTILAYASFLIAERFFHVSGVMAVVAAGLTLGSWGRIKISPAVRQYIDHFWEYMAFVSTALIFLMVGMRVEFSALWQSADILAWVILGMLLSRAIVVYGLMYLSNFLPGCEPTSRAYQTIMYWGGLRGAIALAIVLSIPHFEQQDLFVALVMGAVLFTLLVQGISIEWLVDKLGLAKPPLPDRIAESEGQVSAIQHAMESLPELQNGGLFSAPIANKLQNYCEEALEIQQRSLQELRASELDDQYELALLYLRCLSNERAQYNDLFNKGHLGEPALRSLLAMLAGQIESARFTTEAKISQSTRLSQRPIQKALLHILEMIPGLSGYSEKLRLEHIAIAYEEAWGQFRAYQLVLADLDRLEKLTDLNEGIVNTVKACYKTWMQEAETTINEMAEQYPEFVNAMQERLGMRLILLTEADEIEEQERRGSIPHALAEQMLDRLMQQLWSLRGQEIESLRVTPEELLRKVPFFQEMAIEDFAVLITKMRRHSVPANEIIIRQGDSGDQLFLIARGVVRISRESSGERKNLATLVAGDFFGEMALLNDELRTATVTSVTPCTLYVLGRDNLRQTMLEYPSIRQALEKASVLRKEQQELER